MLSLPADMRNVVLISGLTLLEVDKLLNRVELGFSNHDVALVFDDVSHNCIVWTEGIAGEYLMTFIEAIIQEWEYTVFRIEK